MKVLFVCRRNNGRSQLAEAIFNKLANGKHTATSAGTQVIREDANREGQKIGDQQIIAAMKELGVDIKDNVRNHLTPKMLDEADKVIVMAQPESIPEFLKQSSKAIFWDIPDTFEVSYEFVGGVRDRLQLLINDLIKTLD